MSKYYGKLLGRGRTASTRCGDHNLTARVFSWQAGIEVCIGPDENNPGVDVYRVSLLPHPTRAGRPREIASGILAVDHG